MKRRISPRPALVAGAFSILFTSHAFALNRFFPDEGADNLDNNTIDYNIGTFTNVIVGYELTSDQANQNNTPFPYAVPYATTLNIAPNAVVDAPVEVFNASTLNVTGGTIQSINPSLNPLTQQSISTTDSSTLNINGGTIGSVNTYAAGDTVNISAGSINYGVWTYNGGNVNVTGGVMPNITATNGTTVNISDGNIGIVAIIGQASTGVISGGALVNQASVGGEGISDTGGVLTLDGVGVTSAQAVGTGSLYMESGSADTGDATAADNATLAITGIGSVGGNLNVSGTATVTLNQTAVTGSLLMSGGQLTATGGANFGGGVSLSGSSVATLTNAEIGQVVSITGPSSLILNGCSIDNNANNGSAGITTSSNGIVDVTGASFINGDCVTAGPSSITLSGGIVDGNLYASGGGIINITAGIVNGTAQSYEGGIIGYSGGVITGGITQSSLLGPADSTDDQLAGSLNLESLGGVIDIYGTDLVATLINKKFDGGEYSEYALTGMLADGTEVEGATFLVENSSGGTYQLLPPVPEPRTLALITALSGMLLTRRCRRGRLRLVYTA